MFASIKSFFDEDGFMPHGMCLLWRPDILWTHVIADSLIVIAYFSIPAALVCFACRRRDFPHVWILYLFGAFIVWCGITHATSILTLWVPVYGIQALIKVITAVVSMTTAVMLWPLMPKALRIPSVGDLQAKNIQLQKEITDRASAERQLHELTVSLERRVEERTRELTDANAHLRREVERRRYGEELLLKAKSEAEAANNTKTVFLAGMSHELRSPLNSILGFAQMLEQVYPEGLDERQRAYLKNIQVSGNLLLDLIERLLDLSMVESGRSNIKVEPTYVCECLQKASTILEPMAQKANVALSLNTSECESVVVVADPTRLLQIVVNLGSNAIKYNRPRGRVDITVLVVSHEDIVVRFADTGVGIPAQFRRQVFQPFNRLNQDKSTIHGTGIGLALSKRLAQAMGADLTFESIEGYGSIFDLTLQRAQQFMAVPGHADAGFVDIPRCRILYVDDDPRSCSLIDMYARYRPELAVVHVTDLSEMRAQIAIERPDVLLLDINLPIWRGIDWVTEIAQERESMNIRIIGVATAVNAQTRRYAEDAKITALLTKPIAFRDFALAICEAMKC
ncbi:MAG: response regulator [Rhodospirillaceae bacterium]|nr:MAG: response regulator [Rhodospirillaceae bacterium]